MKILLIAFLFLATAYYSQDIPLKSNEIRVLGVSFREVVNKLLDSNYILKSVDSNYYVVTTEPKFYKNKSEYKIRLNIRIKDLIAIIKGWYGYENNGEFKPGSIGAIAAGVDNVICYGCG